MGSSGLAITQSLMLWADKERRSIIRKERHAISTSIGTPPLGPSLKALSQHGAVWDSRLESPTTDHRGEEREHTGRRETMMAATRATASRITARRTSR